MYIIYICICICICTHIYNIYMYIMYIYIHLYLFSQITSSSMFSRGLNTPLMVVYETNENCVYMSAIEQEHLTYIIAAFLEDCSVLTLTFKKHCFLFHKNQEN